MGLEIVRRHSLWRCDVGSDHGALACRHPPIVRRWTRPKTAGTSISEQKIRRKITKSLEKFLIRSENTARGEQIVFAFALG